MHSVRIISFLNLLSGFGLLSVGVLHFLIIGDLTDFISGQLNSQMQIDQYVSAIFRLTSVAAGLFVLLLGIIQIYTSGAGLQRSKRWGRNLAFWLGLGLLTLSFVLWKSAPEILWEAEVFRIALISLSAVGAITLLPLLFFWKRFNERH